MKMTDPTLEQGPVMTVYRGDFRRRSCPSDAMLVLCDPPYGLKKVYGGMTLANPDAPIVGDRRPFEHWVWDLVNWSSAPWTVIVGPYNTMRRWLSIVPKPSRLLMWGKSFSNQFPQTINRDWRWCISPLLVYRQPGAQWYGKTMAPDFIVCGNAMTDGRSPKGHLNHPGIGISLPLAEWIVTTVTRPGDLVVDPMMGSGSSLIAAGRLGRRVWGCEIVSAYYQDARGEIREACT